MNEIKEQYDLSDLELADIYNSHFHTRLAAPLRDKHAAKLREALECKFRVVKR